MDTGYDSDNEQYEEAYGEFCTATSRCNSPTKSFENNKLNDHDCDSINGIPPSELKFSKESKKYAKKMKEITSVLYKKEINVNKLKKLAVSEGGLVTDDLRKKAWPLLLGLTNIQVPKVPEEQLQLHPEYQQVVLDVNRSLKRFPPGIPLEQRLALQNQLTYLILQVVMAHPNLRYYQGYHDVAVTLLLVTGHDAAYCILEKLSVDHLKECMEPTMDKTSHLLNYIFPLIRHQNKEVYEHLEKSGVGTMFALPWFLTWFGHSLNQYKDVVRLYDYFLASEKLTPLYLSSVIVIYRSKEILDAPCDMANLHSLLSMIPDDLPFEKLLKKTTELYKKYPPETILLEVMERTKREQDQRRNEYALRKQRMNQNLPFIWRVLGRIDPDRRLPLWAFGQPQYIPMQLPRYRYWVATATFAVGLYAVYLKTVEAVVDS